MTTPLSNRRTFLKTLAALSITLASGTKNALAAVLSPAAPSELAAFKGIIVTRAHANYWHWFMAMTWYREKAKRYPALFAQPHDPDDIRLLLAYARHNQMQVTTRASGHNITMPPLRDNALTIDLSLFNQMEDLDVAAKTVWAEPAITSEELNRRLFAHNLVFPSAHTGFVSIGGYLLGGGMGWNMPAYGMGCSSIIAAQLLLADGRIVLASATENADLFWAMRGAGHGFFAIVLRFKLKLHDAPTAVMNTYFFPLDCLDEAVQETLKLTKANARRSELLAALGKFSPPGTPAEDQSWHWVLNVISYGKNEAEAQKVAQLFNNSPLPKLCTAQTTHNRVMNYMDLFSALGSTDAYSNFRTTEMAFFTDQPAKALRAIGTLLASEAVDSRSFGFTVLDTNPTVAGPSCFTYWAPHYISFYLIGKNEDEALANAALLKKLNQATQPYAKGYYLNEIDLVLAPFALKKCFTPAKWARLVALRQKYDPHQRFCGYVSGA